MGAGAHTATPEKGGQMRKTRLPRKRLSRLKSKVDETESAAPNLAGEDRKVDTPDPRPEDVEVGIPAEASEGRDTVEGNAPTPSVEDLALMGQRFDLGVELRRDHLALKIRRPEKSEFIRTYPDGPLPMAVAILEVKSQRDIFVVKADLAPIVEDLVRPVLLALAITKDMDPFLWPLAQPKQGREPSHAAITVMQAEERTRTTWGRVAWGGFDTGWKFYSSSVQPEDPNWTDLTPEKALSLIGDIYISHENHPIIRELRGEF